MTEVQRRAVLRPVATIALVSANKKALALLAQVVLTVPVRDGGQFKAERGDLEVSPR